MKPHLTAISRKSPSLPVRIAVRLGLIKDPVFDYGCGRGADIRYLQSLGFETYGWDPFYFPEPNPNRLAEESFGTVLCTYVLNVVEKRERTEILGNIRRILSDRGRAVVTVRSYHDISSKAEVGRWKCYLDGWLTSRGTFQKGYRVEELRSVVKESGLHCESIRSRNPVLAVLTKPSIAAFPKYP